MIRAAFVPDGEQPPPEFMADFSPLHIRATRDPATGEITCDNAGGNFDGDILAEWYPDQNSEGQTEQDTTDTSNIDSDS